MHFSIRISIFSLFAALLCSAMCVLIAYNYFRSARIAENLSRQSMVHIRERVVQEISDYLWTLERSTMLAGEQFSTGQLQDSAQDWFQYTRQPLYAELRISNLYIADQRGNFLATGYHGDWFEHRFLQVDNTENQINDWRSFVASAHSTASAPADQKLISTYDPRTRPWFTRAMLAPAQPQWSSMYRDAKTNQPSATFSAAIASSSAPPDRVVAADLLLDRIDQLLSGLARRFQGSVVVTQANGTPVGSSNSQAAERLHLAAQSAHENRIDRRRIQGDWHLMTSARLRPITQAQWNVSVVLPEKIILQQSRRTLLHTSLGGFMLLLIALGIARKLSAALSAPIMRLSQHADRLTRLELDSPPSRHSRIQEIRTLDHSLQQMHNSLVNFSRYMPLEIVRQLLASGQLATTGGERRTLTLLFTDIADFTSISENTDPNQLSAQLCDYFEILEQIIAEHQGLVDKFTGDGLMAFWGAPTPSENSSLQATTAALRIQQQLHAWNQTAHQAGKPVFTTRIGIHTGECLVGNIGSHRRLNYTLVGDTVNVAARLETLNKDLRTSVLISARTRSALGDAIQCRHHGTRQLKGRHQPVDIYEPIDFC